MKNRKTLEMVQMAVLTAILLIMAFTPLGYLKTLGLEISLLTIPVVIGAMVLGPRAGAGLGLLFGITSFYQCFGASAFGATLLGINPILTFVVCVPTRCLMGFLAGIVYRIVSKGDKMRTVSCFIGGFAGAFMNTLLFMGALLLCFWNTPLIQDLIASLGSGNVIAFVVAFVGVNGLLELTLTCIVGGTVSRALNRAFRNAV